MSEAKIKITFIEKWILTKKNFISISVLKLHQCNIGGVISNWSKLQKRPVQKSKSGEAKFALHPPPPVAAKEQISHD